MATNTKAAAESFQQDNYNATTSPVTKTPTLKTNFLFIHNLDATNNVLVSFNAGVTFTTIAPSQALSIDCDKMISYVVKSSAGTVAVEAIYGQES